MPPLPIGSSSSDDWDNTPVEDHHYSGDDFSPLPRSPTTPSTSEEKKKKRTPKKSPRPVSPVSTDAVSPHTQKQIIDSSRKEKRQSAPPPPPLSATPSTPTEGNKLTYKVKSSSSSKAGSKSGSKSGHKSSNKSLSISNRSPRTELIHREIANAAAEAATRRRYRRPRKRLHWNNSVRVKVINNLTNYSQEEKLNSWYWPDEYSMMEDECELTSIYMDEIAFERENVIREEMNSTVYERHLPDGFCERGLESWTMQGEELKEQQVQLVVDTVWQAQIDAWEFLGNHPANSTDIKDKDDAAIRDECWEFIRERSTGVSKTSLIRAREFAMMDEQAVDAYLNSVRSLEHSRRRITKMFGGKHSSSRNIARSSRSLTKSKSCRTLTTVASSGSRSVYGGNEGLKSILKSPKNLRRNYSESSVRRSSSHSHIPLKSGSEHSKDNSMGSFRISLPKIGDDSRSSRSISKSLRSNSLRSNSLRSNSLRSNSLRSNNNSLRSNSLRSNNNSLRSTRSGSLRSQLSRSQSVRTTNSERSRSLRSNLSRSNSLRSNNNSLRSNSVRSTVSNSSLLSNSSKKIRYKPKSKIKIPTSPVGSVCNSVLSDHNSLTDEEDLSMRMMRSHMSLGDETDGSSRRRMLRITNPPL